MKALYVMEKSLFEDVYPEKIRRKIAELAGGEPALFSAAEITECPQRLKGAEVVFGSWGSPCFDERLLENADSLKVILFAAGSVKGVVSDAFWKRGLRISSGACANAIPVAEFALGEILLALKRYFYHNRLYQQEGKFRQEQFAGLYRSHVGLVSYGMIAKHLAKLLRAFDLNVHVWAPELDAESAARDGLIYTPLDELFRVCDVVSLHAPLLPETTGMIGRTYLSSMKTNATLINTARGAVIDEAALVDVLRERPDLTALLDVTAREPLPPGSDLAALSNVVLTPHIAGAGNAERGRLGELMLEEFERYLQGMPLLHEVTQAKLSGIA